jgi:gluconate 2-dehydrogenase gamma chain
MERLALQGAAAIETAKTVAGSAPAEPALQQTSAEIDLDFFPLLALHTRQGFYSDPIMAATKTGSVGS